MKNLSVTALLFLSAISLLAQESWKWQTQLSYAPIIIEEDTIDNPPPAESQEQWWEVFGYDKLNELETLALENNYDLKMMQNRVMESRAIVTSSSSALYPSLSLNPSFTRQEFSANRPLGFDIGDIPQIRLNTFSVPLDLNYELDLLGKNRNGVKASQFNLQATEASKDDLTLLITSQIARSYFQLLTLDSEITILESTYKTRQENLEIVESRFNAGLVNEIDLQRARTEMVSIEVQLKNSQLTRTNLELNIATLCGIDPQGFSLEPAAIRYLPPVITPEDPESLSSSRPDLISAQYQLQSFEENLKNSRKQLYPSFLAQGSFGYLSGESSQLFESDSRTWLVGGTISVPIFAGFRRKADLDISKYQLEASKEAYNQQELIAKQEVENALSNLNRLREQLIAQQTFQEAAQKAAELSKERYTKGLVTYLEVVDAERIFLDAERLSVQLLGQQLDNTVILIQALGSNQ